jgi:hypothetical protein
MIVGIDPGLSGAIAWYDPRDQRMRVNDMPTVPVLRGGKARNEIDKATFKMLVDPSVRRVMHVFLEAAQPMPDDGAVPSFHYGKGCGILEGILFTLGVPYTLIHPRTWKAALKAPAKKDLSVARANQLMPRFADAWAIQRGMCNKQQAAGRAEAAMIVYYGATHGGLPIFQTVVA